MLHMLTDLQHDRSIHRGRHTLLTYAQRCSGAQSVLVFALDQSHEQLALLACTTNDAVQATERRINKAQPIADKADKHCEQAANQHIPLCGLFGALLSSAIQNWHFLTEPAQDARCLAEESYWLGHSGSAMLYTLGAGQGLLILCFDTIEQTLLDKEHEECLQICTTLLSVYLAIDETDSPAPMFNPFIDTDNKLIDTYKTYDLSEKETYHAIDSTEIDSGSPTDRQRTEPLAASYEMRLQQAIDQERNRIARNIHDGAAQHIAHVLHKLEFAQRVLLKQPDVALREINRSTLLLKESLHDLRYGIASLIPVELENQEFASAIQALLDEHTYDAPFLKIHYEGDDLSLLPLSLEVVIFRFIQEALNNVRKHAQASEVSVHIRIRTQLLIVTVHDNGRGFPIEQVINAELGNTAYHMGLRSMRERVVQVGGNLEIQSKPGVGTTVKATFFLETPSTPLTSREQEVLLLLTEGLTNRAIAEKLSVSIETVKSHVHHIMQKMHVNDRTQAAVEATKQRLL